jgi:hypothetical protein
VIAQLRRRIPHDRSCPSSSSARRQLPAGPESCSRSAQCPDPKRQTEQIAASIREFGFANPILIDADGVIIAGHGRLLAAKSLGMTEVPTIVLPHLSDAQKRALRIADNKIALGAGWDLDLLKLELTELAVMDVDLDLALSRREDLALHPTVKPTALVADAIQDVTRRGDLVLDIFLGSGTTLIAAERTGRRFRGIDIDPAYVDVALERWSAMTGREPRLATEGDR